MNRLGIPHTLNLYGNGTHTWPLILAALGPRGTSQAVCRYT